MTVEHKLSSTLTYRGKKYRPVINKMDLELAYAAKAIGMESNTNKFFYDWDEVVPWSKEDILKVLSKSNWKAYVCVGSVENV